MAEGRFLDWQEGMMPELGQVLGWCESAKAKGARSLLARTAAALQSAPNNLHQLHGGQACPRSPRVSRGTLALCDHRGCIFI